MEDGEDNEQSCEEFVDESEVVMETAEEESSEGALLRHNGDVKTEIVDISDDSSSQGRGMKNVIVSSVESVGDTVSDLQEAYGWPQYSSMEINGESCKLETTLPCEVTAPIKSKRGRPPKGHRAALEAQFNKDDLGHLEIPVTHGPHEGTLPMKSKRGRPRKKAKLDEFNKDDPKHLETSFTLGPYEGTLLMKSKRGRPRKGDKAKLKEMLNKDDLKHLEIPYIHGPREGTSPIKSKPGKPPKGYKAKLKEMLNKDDLKHLEIPYIHGWWRELVHRNPAGIKCRKGSSTCDVYYYSPEGKKLRSMVEISAYLDSHKDSQVNLTHFTFKRKSLFKPPYEIVRTAGNVRNLSGVSAVVPEKQKKSSVSNKDISKPAQKSFPRVKITARMPVYSDYVKRLTTAIGGPQTCDKGTAERVEPLTKSLTHSESQTTAPERMTAAKEPVFHQPVTAAQSFASQKTGLNKRIRQESPDWTPKSKGHPTLSMKRRNVGTINQTVGTAWIDCDDDDADDGGNLQAILGTPSRFIASVVRSKAAKTKAVSTSVPVRASMRNCNDQAARPIFIVTSTPPSDSTGVCSRDCPGMGGIEPYHPCIQCGRPYHLMCTTGDPNSPRLSLCQKCGREGLKSLVRTPSNPSVIRLSQINMQKLSTLPVALHRLTSLSGPMPSSMVPVSSAFINSPLLTSSQLPPQVLSPIVFIPGGNATAMPPPPPLASRPQFETVTIVPFTFTSSVPPPPRLQLCSTPHTSQTQLPPPLHPPPLFLSNSMLFSSPTNSTITQLPILHSILPSKPVALQTSETSLGVEDIIDVDAVYTNTPPRSLLTHTSAAQKHISSAQPSHSSFLTNDSSASPASEAHVAQSTYHTIKNSSKDETGQDVHSTSNQAWQNEPVSGSQEGLDVSGLGNQAGQNVLCAVRQLVTKRTRSESSSSDSLDYLPVQFQPSNAKISGKQLEKSTAKEVESDCLEYTTREAGQQVDDQQNSESKCSILKGILRQPPVDIVREQGVAALVELGSRDSMLSGCNTVHLNSGAASIVAATTEEAIIRLEESDATPLAVATTEETDIPKENSEPLAIATTEKADIPMEKSDATPLAAATTKEAGIQMEAYDATTIAAATAEKANVHSADVVHTDASGVTYSKDVPSTISTLESMPQPSSSSHGHTQSLVHAALKHPATIKPGQAPIAPAHPQQESGSSDRKTTRKMYLSSFRVLHGSFPVVMKIFTYLSLADLLRASAVCKLWHTLAMQPSLWQCVRLKGIRVRNWDQATQFFHQIRVRSLNFKGADLEATWGVSAVELWDSIKRTVPILTGLRELYFQQVPASVLNSLTEKMPNLVNLSAELIIDSEVINSAPPATVDRTVVNMSHAVDAVITQQLPTKEAARLFHVSENDLIHLAQAAGKLTEDEERAVILCCLRLSHMGFCIQLDTLVSKCQEMFARRYSTTTAIPVSDSYVRDLYICNQPLFMTDTEIASSNNTQQRLDAHYSVLQKLYKSLWLRLTPSPSQILVFDLKHFHLGRDPAFNSVRSVSATVFSTMSASATCLPSMAVWPRYVEAKHTSLINVISSRGLAAYHHVYNYFQKILNLVKIRPLVILCNGNASLLSEKLITSCVMDGVYFYCVPPDITKYVFPGFHGGLLHMLKSYVPAQGLSCEDFASVILFLLNKKVTTLQQSARQAFITTGAFPLNPKAPFQYQTNDCRISQGRPVSLLQPNTINLLKDQLASVRQQQQTPSPCDVMVMETAAGDQAAADKNTEHDIGATSRYRIGNKNKSENTGKNREEKNGCITNKDMIQAKKIENKAVKYNKNKENKRRNYNKRGLQENYAGVICNEVEESEATVINDGVQEDDAIVIHDEVQENDAIVIHDEVQENDAIVIHDETQENDAIVIHDETQENDGVIIHDKVHKSIVNTVSDKVQQSNEAATSDEVQASNVDAVSNEVNKDQPVKVAKTVVGVGRKNKKCSYVQLLARMLLNQAKRNISLKTKRQIFASDDSVQSKSDVSSDCTMSCDVNSLESHSMEAEVKQSASTNKYSLTDHSSSGGYQAKPQAETDPRGPVKGSCGQNQATSQADPRGPVKGSSRGDREKPQIQTDPRGPIKGSNGRDQAKLQAETDPRAGNSGRYQTKPQAETDPRGPVEGNSGKDQAKFQVQTEPRGPVNGSSGRDQAKPQAQTEPRGPVEGNNGRDQAKPQAQKELRGPDKSSSGRDQAKPQAQTEPRGPVNGSSGRDQAKPQAQTDPRGPDKGSNGRDQAKPQAQTEPRGPDKGNSERDQAKLQAQTDPRGPVKGSKSRIKVSSSKQDLLLQHQDKEQSLAALDSSLQEIGSIPNNEYVKTIHIDKCTDNTRRPVTIMDISDIEGEFRNRMNEKSMDDSENKHQNKRKRNRMTEQQSTPGNKQDISFDGEESIVKKKKKKKHKKKKRHQVKEKIDKFSSEADELTLKGGEIASDKDVAGNGKGDEDMEAEEEETALPEELCDFSLIDHDYIVKYDVSGRSSQGGAAEDTPDAVSECADRPGTQVDAISSSLQKSESERHPVGGDIIYVAADENVAETLVTSSLCEDAEVASKSDSSSSSCSSCSKCGCSSDSSSSDEEESSPSKVDSGHTAERLSSSDHESSKSSDTSDEEVVENAGDDNSTNSQDNNDDAGNPSEEDSSDSGSTSDEDEEEEGVEEEDDESLCQICMRSVPPHSKDEIIDWVDCDKNCGRWFHVICITRSQTKADKKRYVCPSCRHI